MASLVVCIRKGIWIFTHITVSYLDKAGRRKSVWFSAYRREFSNSGAFPLCRTYLYWVVIHKLWLNWKCSSMKGMFWLHFTLINLTNQKHSCYNLSLFSSNDASFDFLEEAKTKERREIQLCPFDQLSAYFTIPSVNKLVCFNNKIPNDILIVCHIIVIPSLADAVLKKTQYNQNGDLKNMQKLSPMITLLLLPFCTAVSF